LQSVTKVVVFIILTLSLYLFFSGHNNPGGGFVGGLVLAAAFVLLCLAFDIETVKEGIPVDFKLVEALGAFIVVTTGLISVFINKPFLNQTLNIVELPFFGEIEFATGMIVEAGVSLDVVGVVGRKILIRSEDM